MAKLVWDQTGERLYETGTKKGVLYPFQKNDVAGEGSHYSKAVAWNGLTGVTESPSGAEETALYADDIKYLALRSKEEFGGTITAYTYPDEWEECDGQKELVKGIVINQQTRQMFGLSYRTIVGNDTELDKHGYKLHLVYGATVSPSEKAYSTVNDSPEAVEFSWEFTTTPVDVTAIADAEPTSIVTIDSTKLDEAGLAALATLEDILYGTDTKDGYLPLPDEVYGIFAGSSSASAEG